MPVHHTLLSQRGVLSRQRYLQTPCPQRTISNQSKMMVGLLECLVTYIHLRQRLSLNGNSSVWAGRGGSRAEGWISTAHTAWMEHPQ